jgi:hypothetical protein
MQLRNIFLKLVFVRLAFSFFFCVKDETSIALSMIILVEGTIPWEFWLVFVPEKSGLLLTDGRLKEWQFCILSLTCQWIAVYTLMYDHRPTTWINIPVGRLYLTVIWANVPKHGAKTSRLITWFWHGLRKFVPVKSSRENSSLPSRTVLLQGTEENRAALTGTVPDSPM